MKKTIKGLSLAILFIFALGNITLAASMGDVKAYSYPDTKDFFGGYFDFSGSAQELRARDRDVKNVYVSVKALCRERIIKTVDKLEHYRSGAYAGGTGFFQENFDGYIEISALARTRYVDDSTDQDSDSSYIRYMYPGPQPFKEGYNADQLNSFNNTFDAHAQELILLGKDNPTVLRTRDAGNKFQFVSRSQLCTDDSYEKYKGIYVNYVLDANLQEGDFMPTGVYIFDDNEVKIVSINENQVYTFNTK